LIAIDLQLVSTASDVPVIADFKRWCEAVLLSETISKPDAALTIRLVDNDEMQQLNRDYRHKDKPTNVLSFPFEPYTVLIAYAGDVADVDNLLGDIVMAPAVIACEAQQQGKALLDHYAHMTIHGVLHLLGYDHLGNHDAEVMETTEVMLLATLGINNPYR